MVSPTRVREPRSIRKTLHGVSIVIEYKKGDIKPDKAAPPEADWGHTQHADYGYIEGTVSIEPDECLDVFIGPDEDSECVFLCELLEPNQPVFMEHKILMGFEDYEAAEAFIKWQYSPSMVGFIYELTLDDLREWIELQAPLAAKGQGEAEEPTPVVPMEEMEREPALVLTA